MGFRMRHVALMLCACCVSAHRVQRAGGQSGGRGLHAQPATAPSEDDLRAEAAMSFEPPRVWIPTFDVKKWFFHRLELQRHSNLSIFEQTRHFMESEDPRSWGNNWTGESISTLSLAFKNESGVDVMGLRKEWLSLVLTSIVMPEADANTAGLQCMKSGLCGGDAGAPQYLLKALPSGELIPILSAEEEEPAWAGRVGSVFNFAYGVYEAAYEKVLGPMQSLPAAAGQRFKFLGKWLARSYVITDLGYAPMGFHSLIYKSLVAGHAVEPETQPFYSEEDTIPACEKMAAVFQRRSPQELQSYGWLGCDEVKDPVTGKYTQPSCYKPIYKDEAMWDALYMTWGSLAPDGAKAEDPVPFSAAREYTERRCEESWKCFEEPVDYMAQGFHEVLPSNSDFWKLLDGRSETLAHMVEGNSDVDLDELWEAVEWSGSWDEETEDVLYEVLQELQEEGKGLPPIKRPLNKLLRFFTGSFKKPVEGWKKAKVEFVYRYSKKCIPLVGKTCFNELRIPGGCLEGPRELKEMIAESVVSEDFGYE